MCRRLASVVGLWVHLLIYCSLYSWYDRLLYLLLMSLPCTIPWPCICRAYTVHIWKKSFSFDIMVDVNVYKLYSTCINTCLHGRCGVGSSVNRFIIFLREVWGNYIKMSEKELIWSWKSVHALINKGLLNKHDKVVFVYFFMHLNG